MTYASCNNCTHREVCRYSGLFNQYIKRMEDEHDKYIKETEDILVSSQKKVFSIKPMCKNWNI